MCLLKLFQPLGEAPSPLSFFPNRSVRKARLCTLDAVHLGQPVHQCSCCGSHRSDYRAARVNFTTQGEHRALEAEQAVKHKLSTLISPIPHCSTCFRSSLRHNKSLLYFILFYFIQHTGSIFCMENNNMNTVQSINQPLCSPFFVFHGCKTFRFSDKIFNFNKLLKFYMKHHKHCFSYTHF